MPSGLPRVFQYSFTLKLAAQVCLQVVLSFRLPQSQVTNPLVPLLYVSQVAVEDKVIFEA